MKQKKHSSLYQYIQKMQGNAPWGSMLDAGTGVNSLSWISELETARWTAVTGSEGEADKARHAIGDVVRPQDKLIVGNWVSEQLLAGEVFDTVLADYLLGAVEGFAPCFQPYLFPRLRPHVGKALYVTGLEPYVPIARPQGPVGQIIWEIGRFRDACVLLKGGLPYREYPAPWTADHIRRAGFTVREIKHFKISYKATFINAQIHIAVHGLDNLVAPSVAKSLAEHGEFLREKALELIEKEGALRFCRNYVISAVPA